MKKRWNIIAACLLILICAIGLAACNPNDDDGGTTPLPNETVYTVTFVADGKTVGTDTYTMEDKTVAEPAVPFKAGYVGVWESYTLTEGDITVNAVYTALSPEEAIIGTFYQYAGGEYIKNNYFSFGENGVFKAFLKNSSPVDGSYTIDENANITFALEMGGETHNGDGTLNCGVLVLNLDGQFEILCQEGAAPFADANGAKYVIYNGSAILLSYDGEGVSFAVPESVTIDSAQYDVKTVANYAFQGCGLSSITIGGNVTSIGNYAFKDCNGLTSITIGESVTSVGWTLYEGYSLTVYAETAAKPIGWHDQWMSDDCPVVWNCKNNDVATDGNIYYVDENGMRYAIKDNEASVARQAISIAEAILSSAINYKGSSYNVTSIGTQAFIFCSKLTSVVIPNGITSIGEAAFRNCVGLQGITIPDSVTSIGSYAFYECSALTDITIPNSVTGIESSAFSLCSGLAYISVSEKNTVYSSKDGILYDKAKTRIIHVPMRISGAVAIPSGVTVIPSAAFYGCSGLMSIIIPDGVTSIGNDAFSGCSGLTSISIPDSVTYIGRESFSECHLEEAIFIHYTGWIYGSSKIASEILQDPRLAAAYLLEHNDGSWQNDGTYRVRFVADGITVAIKDYISEETHITEPDVPAKTGYHGAWEEYALVGYVTVNAVYTPIEYTVTFVADGVTVDTVTYTVENKAIIEPTVPEKSNYNGAWESYTLTTGDITVNAVYTPAVYTVTFVADGKTVGTDTYTVEDKTVTEPSVPERENPGYAGEWGTYTLTSGNITVNAVYTLIEYTVTFVAEDEVVSRAKYTVENRNVTEPKVPETMNETGVWESYTLTFGDLTVRALYTSKGATSGLIYELSQDKASYQITGYLGNEVDVMLPALYRNLPVTGIGDNAFSNNYSLKKIYLPEGKSSFTSIGEKAFYNCTALKNVIMSACLVQTIGASAFEGCSAMEVIGLPSVLKEIGEEAFRNCSSLINFSIPDSVVSVGDSLLSGCSALTTVYTGNGISELSYNMFNECNSIRSIHIGSGVNVIRTWFLKYCDTLEEIHIADLAAWCNIDYSMSAVGDVGFLHSAEKLYLNGMLLTDVVIPNDVVAIKSPFYGYKGLKSVTIPDGVTAAIGRYAFSNCSNLTNVIVGNDVTGIEEYAFEGCSGLQNLTIGNGVTAIGDRAFNGCNGLTCITIGSGLTSIDNLRLSQQTELTNITVSKDNNNFLSQNGVLYDKSTMTFVCILPKLEGEIIIPDGVQTIVNSAFENRTGLTSITIPDSVTSIGSSAFSGCSGLTIIMIPDSVTAIGSSAFYGCNKAYIKNEDGYYLGNDNNPYLVLTGVHDRSVTSFNIRNETKVIYDSAFSGCSGLTSITIPNSVTSIGSSAFSGCSGLTGITIPDSVTSIGTNAFYNCTGLTSITIPDSVTSIGTNAFSRCSGLTSITIPIFGATEYGSYGTKDTRFYYMFGDYASDVPASLKTVVITGGSSIGDWAFDGCSGLTSITIPDSVTAIGDRAFNGCTGLTSIIIGNGVTNIGEYAFASCRDLANITVGEKNTVYRSIENCLIEIASKTLIIGCKTSVIPTDGSVTSIASNAFYGNGLTSITIPDSVTSIGSYAFYGNGLTSITIPDSVTSIGSYAFYNCTGLTSIIIGNGVTNIGEYAFASCRDLANITVGEKNTVYRSIENCLIEIASKTLIIGCKTSVIPTDGSVTSIASNAFCGSGLTSITIPDSVTSIEDWAFSQCHSLTIYVEFKTQPVGWATRWYSGCPIVWNCNNNDVAENGNIYYIDENGIRYALKDNVATVVRQAESLIVAVIPETVVYLGKTYRVTSIGEYAFSGCSGLTSITIPDSVTSIGEYAFSGCSGLTSITIPDGVTSIGSSAFYGCSGLTSVEIGNGVTTIGSYAFYGCSGLTRITVPFVGATKDGTENISFGYIFGQYGYYVPVSLKTVIITGGSSIGNSAFSGCRGLTSITIPDSVTSIGNRAFYGCSGLTSITIPDSVTSIGEYAFSGCSGLTSITIPDSVTSIGSSAFNECSGLTRITVPFVGATKDGTEKTSFYNIFGGYNSDVPVSLKTVVITGGSSIGESAFYNCSSLTSIVIPDSVTSIGKSAFYNCSSLTSIAIPDSVTSIGEYAFYGCSGLTSITIPDSVISIGLGAFRYCWSLSDIAFTGSKAQWQAISKGQDWNSNTGNYTITCTDGTIRK